MYFTGAEISALVGTYLWPFFRNAALVSAMPIFNSVFIPIRVRLVIALGITFAIAPVIPPVPQVDVLSVDGLMITFNQVVIGIATGFIFNLVIGAFIIAGQTVAMQMGLGFATMVDPSNGSQSPVMSMFFLILVILFFILLDGHLALIGVLAKSFYTMPIDTVGLVREDFYRIVEWASVM
ncbi:MAG: flagellar biosynthetic protein FliR, partial [Gammaproteobacteria bacterium]|nr:flagellar biosynthetic protein FliR [Gammaproteobacteria bacterium]